jgi:hypothetical protein
MELKGVRLPKLADDRLQGRLERNIVGLVKLHVNDGCALAVGMKRFSMGRRKKFKSAKTHRVISSWATRR